MNNSKEIGFYFEFDGKLLEFLKYGSKKSSQSSVFKQFGYYRVCRRQLLIASVNLMLYILIIEL